MIRRHASVSAQEIVSAIINAVNRLRKDVIPEDDVTLVVIKVTGGKFQLPDALLKG